MCKETFARKVGAKKIQIVTPRKTYSMKVSREVPADVWIDQINKTIQETYA